jgi:hypothetical protein
MIKIDWCLKQKNGIELIEPNDNLSQSYFKEAKDTVLQLQENSSKWDVIMGCYYGILCLLSCFICDCTKSRY